MTGLRGSKRGNEIPTKVDVIVVGGGVAGVSAAVAAGRLGCSVVLTEKYSYLGGLATGGNVLLWYGFERGRSPTYGGISLEVVDNADHLGGVRYAKDSVSHYAILDPEILKYVLQEVAIKAGVEIIQHVLATNVVMQGDFIKGVTFQGKSGRFTINAKMIVDATGDGDIFCWAGAPYSRSNLPISFCWNYGGLDLDTYNIKRGDFYSRFQELVKQIGDIKVDNPYPLCYRGTLWCNGTYFPEKNALSPRDLTEVDCEGRRRAIQLLKLLRKHAKGFGNAFLFNTSTITGVRVARQLKGEHILTEEDIHSSSGFDDAVGLVETTPFVGGKLSSRISRFQIPFRSLFSGRVKNLIVAGRCISVPPARGKFEGPIEHIRPIPQCMVTGQAAGCVAALCVIYGNHLLELSVVDLQQTLEAQRARIR